MLILHFLQNRPPYFALFDIYFPKIVWYNYYSSKKQVFVNLRLAKCNLRLLEKHTNIYYNVQKVQGDKNGA